MALLTVFRLDGNQLDITGECQTVLDVKANICKHWRIPPLCQQILKGTTILDDGQDIHSCFEKGQDISLTMLISFDKINLDLSKGPSERRVTACETLCQLIQCQSYSQALKSQAGKAIVCLFQEGIELECTVKCLAVKALGFLAQQGTSDVVSVLCACVSDSNHQVRNSAVKSLRLLQEEHHEDAFLLLSPYLDHHQWQIRCAAVKGLDSFAKVGNQDIISVVSALLTDPDDSVQMVARTAYNRLAQIGSERGSIAACNARP